MDPIEANFLDAQDLTPEQAQKARKAAELLRELHDAETSITFYSGDGDAGFLNCMKKDIGNNLKSIFDINAIAALIGQKKYFEAAGAAVKYLAKQGIKRNVAGVAATLAFYGGRRALFK